MTPADETLRRSCRPRRLSGLAAAFLVATLAIPAAAAGGRWRGPDGRPLPFTSDEEVLDFLRSAEVVAAKRLADGINKPLKLTLEKDGVRAHAIFRTVDVRRQDMSRSSPHDGLFRDSYRFEVAAYELSRLLDLDHVPPAVLRRFDGRPGSIQLWIEQATSEGKRMARGEAPPSPARWSQQKQMMRVFDTLIYNFDRNHGNMLLDADGKLWLVDHTRSFKQLPALAAPERIAVCERHLWERLKSLDPAVVRERLTPYLEAGEIAALLKRRELLVRRIEELIASLGAQTVLFELAPQPA